MIDYLVEIDKELFLFLNGIHSAAFDSIMWTISAVATWIPLYLGIIIYLFWKNNWKRGAVMLLSIAATIGLADLISVECFKNVFCRLRPTHTVGIEDIVHILRDYRGGRYGFVSSHAANSFAIATITSFFVRYKIFTWAMFIWASVVAYSRIYLGVHFPADILGGAIVGAAIAYLIYKIYVYTINKFNLLNI